MPTAPPVLNAATPPLRVPLYAQSVLRRYESRLVIWTDGKAVEVEPSVRPAVWSTTSDGVVLEARELRRLSDTQASPATWYRLGFPTHHATRDYYEEKTRQGYGAYVGDFDRWDVRILVEDADFFRAWAHTRGLRVLTVDVEQRSQGGSFPARSDPMVSLALGRGDGAPPRVTFAEGRDEPDDAPCLAAWERALAEHDPDLIVAFNAPYDLGVLAARGEAHGFPLSEWGRVMPSGERAESRSITRFFKGKPEQAIWIGGRVVWDVWKNAKFDYNLSGVKDYKLKSIADFLGLPAIRADTGNTLDLWRRSRLALGRYNANDVVILEHLARRYLPDRIALAEFYGAPLGMCIDAAAGWGGNVASARALFAAGIVSDGMNWERHRKYLKPRGHARAAEDTDPWADEDEPAFEKFEGAYIALHKRGLFRPAWKADFASLYPNITIATRSGPDNTRIVGTDAGTSFEAARVGDVLTLGIPDANYGHRWLIEVRGESVFTPLLRARMEDRLAAKRRGDKTAANILKTLLNAMFGVHGSMTNRYGVLPVAIICGGVGRVLARAMERVAGDAAIEVDTDGIFLTRPLNPVLLTRAANREAARYGLEPRFEAEVEEYPAGYFHEAKAYLLLDDAGKLLRFGGAFKGRQHPPLFDSIITRVGRSLLAEGRAAALAEARACLNFENYEPADFVQRVTLSKPIAEYAHESKEVKVARAYERTFGLKPEPGRSYEYVRTAEGRVPPTPANLAQLDTRAYLRDVALPALERLGFADPRELGISRLAVKGRTRVLATGGEVSLKSFL